ncbi:MAG TPA: site-2 protease family protein [Isosphaeraceae bacterium]|jgi:Zn-dependent protease|nr:site-2 protease family protein [Isosphaeraceae bacterium]
MRLSWQIGRVAGIGLFLHPTFLILLAAFYFGGGLPMVALGVAAFGCVLLHELGHALMARRFGIDTHDITLYPIGGVARLARLPRAPGAELLIALAGPAVNIALALILGTVLALASLADGALPYELGVFLAELLWVNVGLAAFNLLPAFPMDGGRVVRAVLSGLVGRGRATEVAALLGQGLALLFGIVSLVTFNPFHIALAAFIFLAAGWERKQVRADEDRRRARGEGQGIWTAPPGYHWVSRGGGVWQLAPIAITVVEPGPRSWR